MVKGSSSVSGQAESSVYDVRDKTLPINGLLMSEKPKSKLTAGWGQGDI